MKPRMNYYQAAPETIKALVAVECPDLREAVVLVHPTRLNRAQVGGLQECTCDGLEHASVRRPQCRQQANPANDVRFERLILHGHCKFATDGADSVERVDVACLERRRDTRREPLCLEDRVLSFGDVEGRAGSEASLRIGNAESGHGHRYARDDGQGGRARRLLHDVGLEQRDLIERDCEGSGFHRLAGEVEALIRKAKRKLPLYVVGKPSEARMSGNA